MAVMPKRYHLRLAAFALLIAGTAVAHEGATGIVAERMKAMEDTATQTKAIDRALKASLPNAADIRTRAERIHVHAHDLMRLFPTGSDQGHTFAAPEIWAKREAFERQVRSYDVASEKLVEAAAVRPLPELRRQFTAVRSQCPDCHERFRVSRSGREH